MGTLRKLTASLKANFEWIVNQVENHEALINSAVCEIQQAQARAKVQLKSVHRDGERLRSNLAGFEESSKQWKERAIKCRELDPDRALECLRRMRADDQEVVALKRQCQEHEALENQLQRDLILIQERLDTLKRKRNLLRTRQSR
ncbi:MAG: PspA/IM30 family protein, partial [Bdellovibrionales bacterium]|nr:PspA/IM30 family protein [Bdellovibrionales bacterium]